MATCNKLITWMTRDNKEITPTLAYRCEVVLPEGATTHEGPCANPSDAVSRDKRLYWERIHAREEEVQRHASSRLAQTRSVPMSSASIYEPTTVQEANNPSLKVGRKHPSEPVDCPFCNEQPMQKDLLRHINTDHNGPPLPVDFDPPEETPSRTMTSDLGKKGFFPSIPMPPLVTPPVVNVVNMPQFSVGEPETDEDPYIEVSEPNKVLQGPSEETFLDVSTISLWFARNFTSIPNQVVEAWGRVSDLLI